MMKNSGKGGVSSAPARSGNTKLEEMEDAPMSTERIDDQVYVMYVINALEAAKLPSMDVGGGVDPFAVFKLGEREVYRTGIKLKDHNPVWNETFRCLVYNNEKNYNLTIEVWDWDKVSTNDFIGSCVLEVAQLHESQKNKKDVWLPINNNKNKHKGDIHLTVTIETFESVERQFWKGITDHFDTDDDSEITQDEFNALLEAVGSPLTQAQMEELFSTIDKNKSGSISFEELYSRVKGCTAKPDADAITKNLLPADPNFIWVVMSHINPEVETVGETVLQDSRWRKEVRMPSQKREVGTSRIMVHDRATGQLVEERIPNYIKVAMRIMYTGKTGGLASGKIHALLQNLTDKQGKKYDDPRSTKDIAPFVKFHHINAEECLETMDSYRTFNEFFFRKLKPSARKIDGASDEKVVVSPADCRLSVFTSIERAHELWIKGKNFSLDHILQDKELSDYFEGGSIAVCRLAPQDYHRFHVPVDGTCTKRKAVNGTYMTVNPIAVNQTIVDVYGENKREVCTFTTKEFGKVGYVCVGATMVGSIRITCEVGKKVKKGNEFGYFAFGGSTILLLFKKGDVEWDSDLLVNSEKCLETLVKMGEKMGKKK